MAEEGGGGQRISDREMERDKRSKASELQRLQLVAEPTAETKSKKINIQHDLQRLSGNCQCRSEAQWRKISTLNCEVIFLTECKFGSNSGKHKWVPPLKEDVHFNYQGVSVVIWLLWLLESGVLLEEFGATPGVLDNFNVLDLSEKFWSNITCVYWT